MQRRAWWRWRRWDRHSASWFGFRGWRRRRQRERGAHTRGRRCGAAAGWWRRRQAWALLWWVQGSGVTAGVLGLKGLTRSLHAIGGRIGRGVLAGEVTEARVFMGSTQGVDQAPLMGPAKLECVKRTPRRVLF